jgi:hypothetical protein
MTDPPQTPTPTPSNFTRHDATHTAERSAAFRVGACAERDGRGEREIYYSLANESGSSGRACGCGGHVLGGAELAANLHLFVGVLVVLLVLVLLVIVGVFAVCVAGERARAVQVR